jgi:hypothetical protein
MKDPNDHDTLDLLELVVPKDPVEEPAPPKRADIRHPLIRLGSGDYSVDLS